jgi:TorA maturation chaperone TorD
MAAIGARAREHDLSSITKEFEVLFSGGKGSALRPYASYYLTGFLYEQPLIDLRADMEILGFARNDGVTEPEDHIACVLEIMDGIIVGLINEPATIEEQERFFKAHIDPWAGDFFNDLEACGNTPFYQAIATLGRRFIKVENELFSDRN